MEFAGMGGCAHFRTPMIHGREEGAIAGCRMLVLRLHIRGVEAALTECALLFGPRSHVDSTSAAVVADARHIVVNDCAVVDVCDVHIGHVDVGHATVVIESAALPISTPKTDAKISVAVVHATVKAHMRAPISGMPDVNSLSPSPVSWRPKQAGFRRHHPGSGNPVVAVGTIRPVARRPEVAISWAGWLLVNRQNGRGYGDGNEYSGERRRRNDDEHQRKKRQADQSGSTHVFSSGPAPHAVRDRAIQIEWRNCGADIHLDLPYRNARSGNMLLAGRSCS